MTQLRPPRAGALAVPMARAQTKAIKANPPAMKLFARPMYAGSLFSITTEAYPDGSPPNPDPAAGGRAFVPIGRNMPNRRSSVPGPGTEERQFGGCRGR